MALGPKNGVRGAEYRSCARARGPRPVLSRLVILALVLSVARPIPASALDPLEPPASREEPQLTVETLSQGEPVADEWTSTRRTYETDVEGAYITEFYNGRVNHQADGRWVPIDPTLVPGGALGYEATSNAIAVEIADTTGDADLAKVRLPSGASVAFGLADPAPVPAVASGATALFENAIGGVDIELESLPSGIKETLILPTADSPSTYRFTIRSLGLTASLEERAIVFRDEAGVPQLTVPPGFMQDSAEGVPAETDAVSYRLLEGGTAVEIELDQSWLSDPGRVYPVAVDPSLIAYSGSDDTYVNEATPGNNSAALTLNVGRGASGNLNRAFLHFATAAVEEMNVHQATLELWQAESYGTCTGTPIDVYPIEDEHPWTAATAWPGPSMDTDRLESQFISGAGYSAACPADFVSTDLTGVVDDWAHDRLANNGLGLRASDEPLYAQFKKFASSQTYTPPSLTVVWTDPSLSGHPNSPTALSPSGITTSSSPTLSATYSDPQNDPGKIVFRTYDANSRALTGTYTSAQVNSNTVASITVPTLPYDDPIYWTATARDVAGTKYSAVSQPVSLVRPPVRMSSPSSGTVVSGATTFTASLGAGLTATSVVFVIDGVAVGTDAAAPYEFTGLNTTAYADEDHEILATIVGGTYDDADSPPLDFYTSTPVSDSPEGSGSESQPTDFDNIFPVYGGANACYSGRTGPCLSDNTDPVTWYAGKLNDYMFSAVRRAINQSFQPTDLVMERTLRRDVSWSGNYETDIVYFPDPDLPSDRYGQMLCEQSPNETPTRCDQFYVYFDYGNQSNFIASNPYHGGRYIRRAMACHETGHTVGLSHGENSRLLPSGTGSIDNDDPRLGCMVTETSQYDQELDSHNIDSINACYSFSQPPGETCI